MMQHVHSMNPNRRQSDLYSKWRKLQQRINRNLESGRFYQFTKRKQQQLLNRLRRYALQLKSLGVPMKRLALGGALALGMAISNGAQAQSYLEVTGEDNPFNAVSVGYEAEPALADVDGDGDLDLFVAEAYGTFPYFTNIGTAMSPSFEATMGENNPLDGVNIGGFPKIALADVDGDGDFDALLGNNYGELFYYQNTGSAAEPTYTATTGADNPFDGISVYYYSVPAFSDIDGDGDLDLIVGDYDGNLNYFRNTGSATAPAYEEQSGMDNPLDGISVSGEAAPTFGDVDDDGDLDAFVGSYDGSVSFVMNMGTATEPMFMLQSGADNPLDGISFGNYSKPALADMDGDGDPDLLVGTSNGLIRYFENTLLSSVENTNIAENSVDLYPNPASSGLVQIDFDALVSGELLLSVYDVSGRMVQQKAQNIQAGANNLPLRVAGLTAGIYQVQLQMEHEIITKKLVIE